MPVSRPYNCNGFKRVKRTKKAIVQREYAKSKYWKRKAALIELLGGKCKRCGYKGYDLEFDHLPQYPKLDRITRILQHSWDKVLKEAKKCQLLCPPCHDIVTDERNYEEAPF